MVVASVNSVVRVSADFRESIFKRNNSYINLLSSEIPLSGLRDKVSRSAYAPVGMYGRWLVMLVQFFLQATILFANHTSLASGGNISHLTRVSSHHQKSTASLGRDPVV